MTSYKQPVSLPLATLCGVNDAVYQALQDRHIWCPTMPMTAFAPEARVNWRWHTEQLYQPLRLVGRRAFVRITEQAQITNVLGGQVAYRAIRYEGTFRLGLLAGPAAQIDWLYEQILSNTFRQQLDLDILPRSRPHLRPMRLSGAYVSNIGRRRYRGNLGILEDVYGVFQP